MIQEFNYSVDKYKQIEIGGKTLDYNPEKPDEYLVFENIQV